MRNLKKVLDDTIAEKDKLFVETVETMETEFRIKYDSMEVQLIEEREIAVNNIEMLRDRDNYDFETRYQKLERDHKELE